MHSQATNMVATGRILVAASVVFVFVVVCAQISLAQTGVCYRRVTRYRVSYRTTTSYYYTSCGTFGWRRCRRTRYGRQSFIQSYNVDLFECCTGYTTCGPNSNSCCKNTNCTTGDVRLVGGSSPLEGRVEVCYYNQWGTVCDDSWGTSDAQVVCHQLGYSSTSATAISSARFEEGTGPIVMDEVRCTGNEGRLMDCPLSLSHNCGHHQDAGVRCTLSTYGCTSGDIRLAGRSSSSTQGRVELCHNNQWGTICDDNWDDNDAEVICKQLQYSSYGALGESNAIFGQGSGSIWLSNVGCNGTEERLLDCSTDAFGSHTCSHSGDAGVTCNTTCTDGDLRLSGGRNGTEGRVEMCSRSEWGTVCGDGWDEVNAQVVCNQLGFSDTGAIFVTSFIGGTGSIFLDDVDCIGNESRLIDCSHNSLGMHDCTHADDAGVRCLQLINECEENTDGCAQTCTDTETGYVCSCRFGFRLAGDRHGCDDIDECSLNTDGCAQICTNTIGSYTCSCRMGYHLAANSHSCEDIDECALNTDGCAYICNNTIGSYTCSCRTGYGLAANRHSCEDIDECALNTDGCAHICNNTIGSYTCSCRTGYSLATDRHSCEDIDECALNTDGCAHNCSNTIGSYTCSCRTGYSLATNGRSCEVPDVPVLTSVNRLSGSSAMISWIPLTQAEARGFLTITLEIAYEPIIDSALNCSTYDFLDSESILVTENLFEKSTANITGLEPNREYCIAIQISTNGGESGFSNAVKLPLPRGAPFQIKFSLPDDLKCPNFVKNSIQEKTASISQLVTHQVAQLCRCRYSNTFIVGSQLLCTTKNGVVYQAIFLPSDSKTALEIRNITQLWILSQPIIVINDQFYRVDQYCSIIVEELGMTSCDSNPSTEALSTNQKPSFGTSVTELASVIGAGILLVLVIMVVVILVICCASKKKTKSYNVGSSQQQSPDSTLSPKYSKDEFKNMDESKSKDNKAANFNNPVYTCYEIPMTTNPGYKYYEIPKTTKDMEQTESIYESLD